MQDMSYVMTPKQVADYLQLAPETVYRYIRQGKLVASRFGRTYRVTRDSVDRLLLATRAPSDIPVRRYSRDELLSFIQDDQLNAESETIVSRFVRVAEAKPH